MAVTRVYQDKTINGKVAAPSNAQRLVSAAEGALLDLFLQSGWTSKEKFWFDARATIMNVDGFVDSVMGWLQGTDGEFQSMGRHPNATATTQRVGWQTTSDGMKGWGPNYPVVAGSPWGTLLCSANAKIPPAVFNSGTPSLSTRCTIALLAQQPATAPGTLAATDDMSTGANQCVLTLTSDDRYQIYSNYLGGANGRTGPSANTGNLALTIFEFDGTTTPAIWRNGVQQAISGTPSCGPVVSMRGRLGTNRIVAGGSFDNSFDGIVEQYWALPDAGSDIRLALKNFCLEKHPSMTIAG